MTQKFRVGQKVGFRLADEHHTGIIEDLPDGEFSYVVGVDGEKYSVEFEEEELTAV